MLQYNAEIDINATPETIWNILTNAPAYTEWDDNMLKLEGTIQPNEQLTIYTKLDPNRAFKPTVVEFEPHKRMVWRSGMPLGLFTGARTFTLTEQNGSVHFRLQEEFSGLMLPMIKGSIPDLSPVFETFVKALKHRAESA